jgi:hypothetical protein
VAALLGFGATVSQVRFEVASSDERKMRRAMKSLERGHRSASQDSVSVFQELQAQGDAKVEVVVDGEGRVTSLRAVIVPPLCRTFAAIEGCSWTVQYDDTKNITAFDLDVGILLDFDPISQLDLPLAFTLTMYPTGVKYAKRDTLVWCFEAMQELHHGATLLEAPHVARLLHRALDVCTPPQLHAATEYCDMLRPGSTSQQS